MRKKVRERKFQNRRHKYMTLLEGREEGKVPDAYIAWWVQGLRKPELWGIGPDERAELIKNAELTQTLEEMYEEIKDRT